MKWHIGIVFGGLSFVLGFFAGVALAWGVFLVAWKAEEFGIAVMFAIACLAGILAFGTGRLCSASLAWPLAGLTAGALIAGSFLVFATYEWAHQEPGVWK